MKMQKSKSLEDVCPVCGRSEERVRAEHRLGCPNCIIFFRDVIDDMLAQQMSTLALPSKDVGETILEVREASFSSPKYLNMLLEDAVEREDYEAAIYYRDKIKALEENETQSWPII